MGRTDEPDHNFTSIGDALLEASCGSLRNKHQVFRRGDEHILMTDGRMLVR